MHDTNEAEPAEVEEVLEVVIATKLMTEVVTTAAPITTVAQVKSKDKGKGILIEEPKPLKRQAQIEQDEAFARKLKAELNANINWNDVLDKVKRREKQDNTKNGYQALKRKHMTEAQARKNMMIYLKNMAGFKMDFFKGMTYSEIRPIFEKHYNSIQAFLEKEEDEVAIQEEGSKRKGENIEQETAKKQRIDEDAEELKRHLQIVVNNDDDVYTEATPLASKLVKERFESTEPNNFLDDFLLNTFKIMFEKPNVEANVWRDQKGRYGLAKSVRGSNTGNSVELRWPALLHRKVALSNAVELDRCETQRRKAKELRDRDTHISLQQNFMIHIWREVEEASKED
uniref:Uncharacterized protein n=1 Tax=Tanacetum cinerariifolium TaxID=118510 RepID=A0A699GZ72_TANCI|nr:hypothetical protein [Tanacetum cinerariifolium]